MDAGIEKWVVRWIEGWMDGWEDEWRESSQLKTHVSKFSPLVHSRSSSTSQSSTASAPLASVAPSMPAATVCRMCSVAGSAPVLDFSIPSLYLEGGRGGSQWGAGRVGVASHGEDGVAL